MCSFWEWLFEKFRKFPRKTSRWNCFFKQSCRLPNTYWGMFFWEIYEILRTGFTRNSCKCRLLQLVVAGKCLNRKIFFKKFHLIWYSMACAPRNKVYNRRLKTFHDVYLGLYLVCSVPFSSCFIYLDKWRRHEHWLDCTYSYFF